MRCIRSVLIVGLALLAPTFALAQDFGKELKGSVVFDGDKIPAREPLKVDKDQAHCLSKGDILAEDWIVNPKNKGIKNVFIWLEAKNKDDAIPVHADLKEIKQKEVMVDQPCCMFVPSMIIIRQGQTIVVKNSAPIQHNFRWAGHPDINPGGNVNMIPGGSFKIDNLKADPLFPVLLQCDIHGWMKGYVRVFDHPYFAVTDENGAFTMPNPPAGDYKLKVWHPGSGWLGGAKGKAGLPITIAAGEVKDMGQLKIEKK